MEHSVHFAESKLSQQGERQNHIQDSPPKSLNMVLSFWCRLLLQKKIEFGKLPRLQQMDLGSGYNFLIKTTEEQ